MAQKRLSKIAKEFNVGISTIVEFLAKRGHEIEANPNTKIPEDLYDILAGEYSTDLTVKRESERLRKIRHEEKDKESVSIEEDGHAELVDMTKEEKDEGVFAPSKVELNLKVVDKIDVDAVHKRKSNDVVSEEKQEDVAEEVEEKESTGNAVVEDVASKEVEEPAANTKKEEEVEVFKHNTEREELTFKVVDKIDLSSINQKTRPMKKTKEERQKERDAREQANRVKKGEQAEGGRAPEKREGTAKKDTEIFVQRKVDLEGPKIVDKIDVSSSSDNKRKRKRIQQNKVDLNKGSQGRSATNVVKKGKTSGNKNRVVVNKAEVSEEDVQKQIKDTLARLTNKKKSKGAKHRREKRDLQEAQLLEAEERKELESKVLKITEYVTASELASLMDVNVNQIIGTCMGLGLMVSINQRLDAETIALLAEEYNYTVDFVSVEVQEAIEEEEDSDEDMIARPPIVTVMGHVDHGKTSLLDYIRSANVIEGEAGGITQHIGAYKVKVAGDKKITFLDTPGHEAFTAMRARGAKVTDIVIIIVAADDDVMPQTIEAINHASAAGVPIVFAINKIDKPGANPDKIKEKLANMNYMVEDWGGKYQSQEISAKNGTGIEELLDKVLLEAELLDLKANPNKRASGSIVESTLDKGRGYVATMLVGMGTLKVGDIVLAGAYHGHVKAMFNEHNQRVQSAGPSEPVLILGLNGAPTAGDNFNVMSTEKEARDIANKREQLQREQGLRTHKHITLDEIGRRIAIGNFQELKVIVKGDVDGSIEALSDSLIKLSTDEIQVNVIHKAVGQISESDIMLATASNAIVIGFQVRPSMAARKLAEKEEIDIRLYSIIYDAIEELKSAMEGMLSPEIKEKVIATLEVREVFKITKVGTVAGCMVKEGKIKRHAKVRLIRDGIVTYTGELAALRRFKDDVKEVASGYECGVSITNYNDIKLNDIIEAYEEIEVQKTL